MELTKIKVDFSSANPQCEVYALRSEIYDTEPGFKLEPGAFLMGTDGDYRCKLEVLEVQRKSVKLAMHLDTWRTKVAGDLT